MAVEDLAGARRRIARETGSPEPAPEGVIARAVGFVRRHLMLVAGVAGVLVLALGYVLFAGGADTAGAPIIVAATRGDVEDTVTALGSLQPRDYVDVGAQVSGQLKTIAVKIGDTVAKGQFLAEIDSTVQASKVQSDRDQLLGLQAQLADKVAQANLTAAQAKRQAGLLRVGGTPKDTYQVAQAAARSAAAQVSSIRAQIAQAQSTLNGDSATLGYAKIYAPMAGTVVSITSLQGQTLNASQQAPIILRIADLSTMTVWTQVSEADVPKLRAGMETYFTTLGSPDKRWTGTLRQILPTPEVVNNVVLYTALFDVANPNRTLMPQMTAQVFFVAAAARNVVTVPVAALHYGRPDASGNGGARRGNRSGNRGQHRADSSAPSDRTVQGRSAWASVVTDSGTEVRRVRVGVSNRVSAEIKSGLVEGERVIAGTEQANAPASSSGSGGGRRGGAGGLGGGRFP